MAHLVLLVPVAGLALASLLAYKRTLVGRRTGAATVTASLTAAIGALAVLVLAFQSAPAEMVLVLSPWGFTSFAESIALSATPLTGAALLLVTALATLVSVRAAVAADPRPGAAPLVVAAASALFVLGAAKPLGLVFAWLVLDVALFLFAGTGRHGLLSGQLGLMMAVGAVATLPWEPAGGGSGVFEGLRQGGRFLLVSAGAVRMGLFPIWWAVPPTDRDREWLSLGIRLAPIVAGGYLVLLLAAMAPLGSGLTGPALLPVVLSVLGAAALSWLAAQRTESHDWQTAAQATLLLMAAVVGGNIGQAIGLIVLVDLVLVRSAIVLVGGRGSRRAGRIVVWALALAAAGVPPTLGFAGRWLLYRELLFSGLGVVVLAIVAATIVTTTALWDSMRLRGSIGQLPRTALVAAGVLAASDWILGIALPYLEPVIVPVVGTSLPRPLSEIVSGLSSPPALANTVVLLAAVLSPAAVALVVRRTPRAFGDARRRGLRRAFRLTRASAELAGGFIRAGAMVHRVTGLLESRRAMAWTVMAAAITASALVVSGGAQESTAAAPAVTAVGLFVFAVAGVVGVATVLARRPGFSLAAVLVAYLLSGAVLWLSAVPWQIVLIKLFAGALAIAILAIGVLQAPLDRPLAGARSLIGAAGVPESGEDRILPALSLAIGLLIALGTGTVGPVASVPPEILRPAFALAAAGVVAAVFAPSSLRLAVGVLVALVGFELAYAWLDPGLVVTGALAAFQLLFAVVASYYVGMSLESATDAEPEPS